MTVNRQEPSETTKQTWIAQAQAGNRYAFEQLFRQYQGRTYALCLRLTANVSMAEDATQEVFVHLWQKIHLFDHQSAFSTWLHSLAANVTISYLRKHKSWLQRIVDSEDKGMPEAQCSALHDYNGLDKLIFRLPERARMVFVLAAIEGYRHEEIGQLLNMAPGTSKAQYHRAKQLLQQWWQDE